MDTIIHQATFLALEDKGAWCFVYIFVGAIFSVELKCDYLYI